MKSCMVLAPRPPTQLKQAILWGATPPRPTGLIPDTALGLKRYEYRSWWSKRNASCLLSLNARRISRTSRPILGTYRSFWQRYLHPTRCAQQRMQSKRSRSSKKFWSCPVLLVATPGPLRSWICIDRKSLQRKRVHNVWKDQVQAAWSWRGQGDPAQTEGRRHPLSALQICKKDIHHCRHWCYSWCLK